MTSKYTKAGRLEDLLALISCLATHPHAFLSEKGCHDSLRRTPLFGKDETWLNLASQHPEFFRFNGEKNFIALTLRSYFPDELINVEKLKRPLTIDETQKVIESALRLYDNEISRKRRFTVWGPAVAAITVAFVSLLSSIYTNFGPNNPNDIVKKLDSVSAHIDTLQRVLSNMQKVK
jgi:hypothetical protein